MTTYIAMLRGINVSGQNKIAMGDLRSLVASLGYRDVRTYIQSGNVILTSPATDPPAVAGAIEHRITDELGLTVSVLLRTRDELSDIIANNPFLPQGAAPTHLHVTFLADVPDQDLLDHLEVPNASPDGYRILGREIYLHCPQGYGRTKLTNAFWERRLRMPATTRNWNTATRLLTLAGEEGP